MATKIRILPDQLTNKIAAGEVVERPASAIKELLENALDAGCTEVTVEIEGGGKRLIKVADDGFGMSREDALLSLERHATSKISSDGDLFTLTTLGFRGEALPSIASVSRFLMTTRERGRLEGTELYAEGGRIREVKACGMAEGTVIEVRNLFFNTPGRLRFLKSSETEAGHVGELLTRLAISRPEIRFTYLNEGKTVFRVLQGDLRHRVASLFGATLASDLYPFEVTTDGLALRGLISRPECSRSAASYLYTYINGRFIRDKVVQHAILQAYKNVLERGRYPVVVLFIESPAGDVDVNVHPTKHEVRFREQRLVHDAIQSAIATVLAASPWIQKSAGTAPPFSPRQASLPTSVARIGEVREILAGYRAPLHCQDNFPLPPPGSQKQRTQLPPEQTASQAETGGYFSRLSVIGQFNAAYLLCQEGSDLVIIDQHAAHERVAFERLKGQYVGEGVAGQGLLFPETVELSFREAATLKEHLEEICRLGFNLEAFGGTTWLLQGVPHLVADGDYLRILRDIIEELQGLGKTRAFGDILEAILIRIACHSVVRGQHLLEREQIAALFNQMDQCDFAGNCPHGRPVYRKMPLSEIEKMFKRN